MSENQQIVKFPFKPHLAQYLFYSIKKEVISTEEERHKTLEINLNSIDGKIIRTILEKVDYPDIKKVKRGFSLTISIPKRDHRKKLYSDGRSQELSISPEAVQLINDLYQIRFENEMICYIVGRVAAQKRGGIKEAIEDFIKAYHLVDTEYNFDRIRKLYQRTAHPLKKAVYEKSNDSIYMQKKKLGSKSLITRHIK